MNIGVLALQGAFREHRRMLETCVAQVVEVRKPTQLDDIQGLVIPGGESTTMGKLMVEWGLFGKIKQRAAEGMAIYGTCAGMILLATDIVDSDQPRLGLMNTTVRRNAYGRQRDSFEANIVVPELGGEPLHTVYIRAPYIEQAGPDVRVMAVVNERIVMARQGKVLVTAFHPELTNDQRVHRYFLRLAGEARVTDASA